MQQVQIARIIDEVADKINALLIIAFCLILQLIFIPVSVAADTIDDSLFDESQWGIDAAETTISEPLVPDWQDRLRLSGYLKNETAYRYDEPRSITKIRNILSLSAQYEFSAHVNLQATAWAYHDLVYQLFDYETVAARFVRDNDKPLVFVDNLEQKKDTGVTSVREFYLDIYLDDLDMRIGRQFIIWGVFDGIRITDELNPLNFRELVLPDLLDYRVPLWSLKLDYYQQQGEWELVWIPDIQFHKPAPRGSEWELLQEVSGVTQVASGGVQTGSEYHTTYPDTFTLGNSEYGVRYKTNISGMQLGFSYFYTWDDFPVIFRTIRLDSVTVPEFFPTYTRINIFGTTLVKPLGETILKFEMAWIPDKYFGLERDVDLNNDGFLDGDGVLKLKHFRWGLGVDFNWLGIDFSPAVTQWVIFDYVKGLIQDKYDTSLTLFARKPLPEDGVVLQLLAISLINMNELYLKPKVTFDISDHFKLSFGMDLFYGVRSKFGVSAAGGAVTNLTAIEQSAQFFGNFHNNDRVFAEFKYNF